MLASPETLRALANEHGTPLYLLDTRRILASMDTLRDGLALHYPNSEITYSVKTNYLSHILCQVLAHGYRLEVVSRHELSLAQQAGASPTQLLFNGPIKSREDLEYCYLHSIHLNLDSFEELQAAATIGNPAIPFRVGLRAAATLKNGNTSRFGIHFEDPQALAPVRQLLSHKTVEIIGLHTHHSSRRDAQSYCDRIDHLASIAHLLNIQPAYLDIGGGIGSVPPPEIAAQLSYPIDDPQTLAQTIGQHARKRWPNNGPRIILEPGIAILANSMNYLTRIASVKARGNDTIAACDGSLFDVNPLRSSIAPPCHLVAQEAGQEGQPTRLYGGTCMEIDQIGILPATQVPHTGDLVAVTNVGAYSACLAPHFIIPMAPIYSLDAKQLIRPRATLGQMQAAGQLQAAGQDQGAPQ
jgi:diaminopimelate decarboxylase